MDKNKAFTKIEYILFSKENKDKTYIEQMTQLLNVLEELESYSFRLGKRQGMFKAINILEENAEKEGKNVE